MVARYKVHKFRGKWNYDISNAKFSDPDSAERQQAKKDVIQGISDNEDSNDLLLRMEAQEDAEERLDWECWMRQKADPENYVCRCFEPKEEEHEQD